jgi:hypothetical protein
MSRRYGRNVYVVIGTAEQAREIRGLRIAFDVEKTDGAPINTAKLQIYNPNADTIALASSRNAFVQLFAGYGEQPGMAFTGAISRAIVRRERPDVVLELESGDGQRAQSSSVQTTLAGGARLVDALGPLADLAQLALDVSGVDLEEAIPAPRGLTLAGQTLGQINRLSRLNRFDWTIEDGRLIITRPGEATRLPAVKLTPETGLIGSPGVGDAGRVEFKALLDAELRLRRIVQLTSRDYDGWYLVRKVKHTGDSGFSDEFYSTCEASQIRPRRTP